MSESKPDIDAGAEAEPPRPEPAGEGYTIDTTYLRSLEGIFRIIELVSRIFNDKHYIGMFYLILS